MYEICISGLPIRGHEEIHGNFYQLLQLRKNDIPELSEFLSRKKSFISPNIQNEIIELMASSILREVLKEIREARYFSLIVDETTDSSSHEQVAICVRIAKELEPKEFFLGLYETSTTTGRVLANTIIDALVRFNLPIEKLRGQCYDGGANMAGVRNGVQNIIKAKQPLAVFIHCTAHSLNLAVQDSVKQNTWMRDTLFLVNEIGVFIQNSPKRVAAFECLQQEYETHTSSPRPLCSTRWTVRVNAVDSIIKNYNILIEFFGDIADSNTERPEVGAKANGLLKSLENWITHISLYISYNLLEPVERLSKILQTQSETLSGCREAANLTVGQLKKMKNSASFQKMWNIMMEQRDDMALSGPDLPRGRRSTKYVLFSNF